MLQYWNPNQLLTHSCSYQCTNKNIFHPTLTSYFRLHSEIIIIFLIKYRISHSDKQEKINQWHKFTFGTVVLSAKQTTVSLISTRQFSVGSVQLSSITCCKIWSKFDSVFSHAIFDKRNEWDITSSKKKHIILDASVAQWSECRSFMNRKQFLTGTEEHPQSIF